MLDDFDKVEIVKRSHNGLGPSSNPRRAQRISKSKGQQGTTPNAVFKENAFFRQLAPDHQHPQLPQNHPQSVHNRSIATPGNPSTNFAGERRGQRLQSQNQVLVQDQKSTK